jgi:hypothetical protein
MGDSASAAPDVTGSHGGTIAGRASVDMPGTPLTPAEFAQNAGKSGSKPSACTANNGHGTTIGMCGKKTTEENSASRRTAHKDGRVREYEGPHGEIARRNEVVVSTES